MEANTPSAGEQDVKETYQTHSPPHIVMGIESMQVDSTHIIMDTKENTFATYGTTVVGNITSYTRFDEEDKEEEERKRNEENKMLEKRKKQRE